MLFIYVSLSMSPTISEHKSWDSNQSSHCKIDCSNTTSFFIDTFEQKLSFWTSPHWARPIDTLSISTINLCRKGESLYLQTPHSQSRSKAAPTHTTRDQVKMVSLRKIGPSHNKIREMRRQRRTNENGASTLKSLGTKLKNVAPSSHSWLK
jgi:hypothetical protein